MQILYKIVPSDWLRGGNEYSKCKVVQIRLSDLFVWNLTLFEYKNLNIHEIRANRKIIKHDYIDYTLS